MPIQAANDPESFQDFEHTGWSVAAETYENVTGLVTAQSACNSLDAAGVKAGCKMLDVCTGHGGLARAATERGAHACAVDFVEEMVNAARRDAPMADCRRGDAQELPLAAVEQGIEKLFRSGNGFQIPMPVLVGSGTKPLPAGD